MADTIVISTFDEYQKRVGKLAQYPNIGTNLLYPALGIGGESGEVVDKIKKLWRNRGITSGKDLDLTTRTEIVKEAGDVLWYLQQLATELGVPFSLLAEVNVLKLEDRTARGVVKGEGDNR